MGPVEDQILPILTGLHPQGLVSKGEILLLSYAEKLHVLNIYDIRGGIADGHTDAVSVGNGIHLAVDLQTAVRLPADARIDGSTSAPGKCA